MRNVMGLLRREINKQLVASNSSVLTSLLSLNGDPVSGITTGFLQQGAPTAAGQTNTVGGLPRSLVPDGSGLFNRTFNSNNVFGTDGIRGMHQLAAETSARAPMGEIKLVLASENGYANYRRSLFQQERYVDEKQLNAGFMSLAFGNAAVVQDVFMPKVADMDTGGTNANTMYFINFDGIKLVMHSEGDLAVSPFEYIPGTTARSAQIYWKGQLIADNLASCAVLYNGEGY